ncbi:MAG: TrmB family transcriptional regulator [Candidatus Woesearchaeota archaeon]
MDITYLQKIGLTQSEAKVYVALLRIGTAKTGQILKESALNSGKIYELLYGLQTKGLVTESIIDNIRHFSATSPQHLLAYLDEKEKEIQQEKTMVQNILIPQLSTLQFQDTQVRTITYLGYEGLKNVVREIFSSAIIGEQHLVMGVTGNKSDMLNNFWKKNYCHYVTSKKIRPKVLFKTENTPFIHDIIQTKGFEIRTTTFAHMIPIAMYGDTKILIMNYDEPMTFILIYSKKITASFKELFYMLWENAKKIT